VPQRRGFPNASPNAAGPLSASPPIRLIRHSPLVLRLRLKLSALQALLNGHSFWAEGRSAADLRRMLAGSQAIVSAWCNGDLVGFGRATSDGVFRAVLWDVVVAEPLQGQGLGRRLVESLLSHPKVAAAERVYLMTTNSAGFYQRLGFEENHGQRLLRRSR
jgi:ribosomal protein S18 acetylase RimI-like enzyme